MYTVILDNGNADLLRDFSCGNDYIDNYVSEKGAYDFTAVTKMVLNSDNNEVICVYSLCCSSFLISSKEKLHPNPAVEIKIFAVSQKYQDIKYSRDPNEGCLSNFILNKVIGEIFEFTDDMCGANIILLYSTDEGYDFYKKNGFKDFLDIAVKSDDKTVDGCYPMFMTMR